jgi:hypothetical protein
MTPEQILHKWDTHVGTPNDKHPFTDDDKIAFARAIIAQARAEWVAELKPAAWMMAMTEYPKPRFIFGSEDPTDIWGASYIPLAIIPKA